MGVIVKDNMQFHAKEKRRKYRLSLAFKPQCP